MVDINNGKDVGITSDMREILKLPYLTQDHQTFLLKLYHETRRRTDTKRHSANKFYETVIQMIKTLDPPTIVKNGKEWRRYTHKDVIITPPMNICANGKCERVVTNKCLERNCPYQGDVLSFLREEIFYMECQDGSVEFDTRQMQQEKRRILIEAEKQDNAPIDEDPSNRSKNSNNKDQTNNNANNSNNSIQNVYETPSHLLTNDQLIQKYGKKINEYVYPYVKLFDLHILLQSVLDNMTDNLGAEYGECVLDDGGCFITNKGIEKVIMFRHGLVPNVMLVQFSKKGKRWQYQVEIRSEHTNENRSTSTFYFHFVDDRLMHLDEHSGQLSNIGYVVGRVSLKLQNIPFVVWIRALGFETDDEIRQLYRQICGLNTDYSDPRFNMREFEYRVLERCILDHRGCLTTHDAILKIGSFIDGKTNPEHYFWGRKKLRTEVLPHIGKANEPECLFQEQCRMKARLLCHALRQLLLAVEYGMNGNEDSFENSSSGNESSLFTLGSDTHVSKNKNVFLTPKDSYFIRQFQTIDELTAPLLQQYLRPFVNKFIAQAILKKLDRGQDVNYYYIWNMQKISKKINYNISMGVWQSQPNGKGGQTGISQNVGRHNYLETCVQHDKIMNPIHKEGKQIDPRLLPATAACIVDAVDTPEGESSGLHRQMGQFTHQSIGTNPDFVIRLLKNTRMYVNAGGEEKYFIERSLYQKDKECESNRDVPPNVCLYSDIRRECIHQNFPHSCFDMKAYRLMYDYQELEGVELLSQTNILFWNVIINQIPIGFTVRPDALLRQLRLWRRENYVSDELSCGYAERGDPYDVSIGTLDPNQYMFPTALLCTHGMIHRNDGSNGNKNPKSHQKSNPGDQNKPENQENGENVIQNYFGPVYVTEIKKFQETNGNITRQYDENIVDDICEQFVDDLVKRNQYCFLDFDIFEPYENPFWCMQSRHLQRNRGTMLIDIRTHVGRNLREVFVIENLYKFRYLNLKQFSRRDLMQKGILEYMEVNESRDCLIAPDLESLDKSLDQWMRFYEYHHKSNTNIYKYKSNTSHSTRNSLWKYSGSKRTNTYSHIEFHPSAIYGICTALIPMAQCNPPARNSFSDHMMKSSQGKATSISKLLRMDTNYNELWISERPEVTTQTYEALGLFRLSYSTNLTVEIQCWENEEDGGIVNQCTVDSGYLNSSNFHTYPVQEKRHKNVHETIHLFGPDQCSGYKIGCDYGKLDEFGVIIEDSLVEKNTVLVQKSLNNVDTSFVYPGNKFAIVDKVEKFMNDQGINMVKIRLREVRKAQLADKANSSHAQKITISKMVRRENMQYDPVSRTFADVIYSTVSKVSRMTIGMILEMILGLISARMGEFADGTPLTKNWTNLFFKYLKFKNVGSNKQTAVSKQEFIEISRQKELLDMCQDVLKDMGLSTHVSHIDMRNGQRVYGQVFRGICSMMKLRQMIIDKIKARGTGPNSYSTKQPQGNKALHGLSGDPGQKLGVMETANLGSYAAANIIYDRLLLSSDPTYTHICKLCNKIAYHVQNPDMNFTFCPRCSQVNTARRVLISGTFQLFTNELQASNFDVSFATQEAQ